MSDREPYEVLDLSRAGRIDDGVAHFGLPRMHGRPDVDDGIDAR